MLARNFATTTASTLISMVLGFVSSVIVSRLLGAEKFGVYSLALLVPDTLYIFSTLGLTTAYIVYSGKHPEKRGAMAIQSLIFSFVAGVLTLLFYIFLLSTHPAWFERFQVVGGFNLILASLLVPLQLGMINLRSVVLGANRITTINLGTILTAVNRILVIIIFVGILGWGVRGGIISQIANFLFVFLFMAIAIAIQTPFSTWCIDIKFFVKSLVFGAKLYLGHIAWWVLYATSRYMIAYMIPNSDEALGQYVMAAQLCAIIWILPDALQTVFLPHLSTTGENKQALTVTTIRIMFIAFLPIIITLILLSPMIKFVFGQDYAMSVLPFVAFMPGLLLFASTRPLVSYLTHLEKPGYSIISSWIGVVSNVVLNYFFIHSMGIVGAAIATSISNILMALVLVLFFKYESGVPLYQFVPQPNDLKIIKNVIIRMFHKIFNLNQQELCVSKQKV
ncbi:MAG: oligosaccharide flippase family protein [Phycisphaerae bacterium]|jgi:O-antigen/teichoic acid export membrane protein